MKKFFLLLLVVPQLAFANSASITWPADSLYYDTSISPDVIVSSGAETGDVSGQWGQVQIYYADSTFVCRNPIFVAYLASDSDSFTLDTTRTGILEIDWEWSNTGNGVDGDNCLTGAYDSGMTMKAPGGANPVLFGVPSGGGATTTQYVISSTTNTIVDNPALDWFLGAILFFISLVFPIWLFKRK